MWLVKERLSPIDQIIEQRDERDNIRLGIMSSLIYIKKLGDLTRATWYTERNLKSLLIESANIFLYLILGVSASHELRLPTPLRHPRL